MDNRPIGVFDTGLGGLTAVKELMSIIPNEDIVYFGDTARVPYGTRSREIIIKYAEQDLKFLLEHNVKAILVACGTISSVALDSLKKISPVFISGVVTPTVNIAVKSTKNKKIGVLGTGATISSGAYERYIKNIEPQMTVISKACPLFVPLVENGYIERDNKVSRLVVEDYLENIKNVGVDTVILGCTHYPILKNIIRDYLGKDVTLIDSGRESALILSEYIKNNNLHKNSNNQGSYEFYVSDAVENFARLAEMFLERNLQNEIKKVDIE